MTRFFCGRHRRLSFLAALTAALLTAAALSPASAQTQALNTSGSAAEDLESFAEEVIVAMNGAAGSRETSPNPDRETAVRRILSRGVDLDAIAGFVLGDHQSDASTTQLDRYGALYNRYLLNMLSGLLLDKRAKTLTVIESEPRDGATSVLSEIELASGETLEWRWLLHKDGPEHRVIDLETYGVSLASMLKFEADSVIRRKGFNEFLDALQRKL